MILLSTSQGSHRTSVTILTPIRKVLANIAVVRILSRNKKTA
jgi:hypothetical protein